MKLYALTEKVFRKLPRTVRYFVNLFSFRRLFEDDIRAWSPDIIYSHDLLTLGAAAPAANGSGARLIYDAHELETERNPPMSALQRLLTQWIQGRHLRKCDAIYTVCEPCADHLKEQFAIDKPAVFHNSPRLRHNIDHERWAAAAPTRHVRREAGFGSDKFVLVYIGFVTFNRGVDLAIDALARLEEDVVLVTVGPSNKSVAGKLREHAVRVGVQDRFVMLPPATPANLLEAISDADASIIPILPACKSYELSLPNKVFEAVFAGLPVIAADLTALGPFVREERVGVTYDPLDPIDCADKIRAVRDEPERFAISIKHKNAFVEKYSWETQAKALRELFASL